MVLLVERRLAVFFLFLFVGVGGGGSIVAVAGHTQNIFVFVKPPPRYQFCLLAIAGRLKRHPNGFGDLLLFSGWSLHTLNYYFIALPSLMAAGFISHLNTSWKLGVTSLWEVKKFLLLIGWSLCAMWSFWGHSPKTRRCCKPHDNHGYPESQERRWEG